MLQINISAATSEPAWKVHSFKTMALKTCIPPVHLCNFAQIPTTASYEKDL
jgi:hypothetical protein